VFIDDVIVTEQLQMIPGEHNYDLATNLTAADHTVEIMKITEGAAGKSSFKGFTVTGGNQSLLDLPAKANKKIEFIGDSWTCGFGNLSQYATGNASMVNGNFVAVNEDNYYAWGPITARALGAEYHVTATSGRGLYRNNTGSTNNTLPKNYDNTLEDDASVSYNHSTFHPDVVVIHLGTNDMAQEEGGSQFALDDAAFTSTYIAFINKIRTYHPCTNVIICFGNSKSDSWPTWTHQLTRLRNIANTVAANYPYGHVTTLELPFTAEKWTGTPSDDCGYGDAWHPSKCSHEEMSVKLVQKINAMNINWGATGCGTGVEKNAEPKNELTVYPNPAQNQIFIANLPAGANYKIVNKLGQTVLEGNSNNCNVEKLESGVYYLIINSQNTLSTRSFVKM
jgi:lysophospholipase L1-like esterase